MAEQNEITDKPIAINRVAKVVRGGRRFSFSMPVVAGDGKGRVGFDLGKASEVMDARTKGANKARKNMVKIPLKEGRTLHHDVIGYFGAVKVIMRSAPPGTGIIAGGPVRTVCEMLGIRDVVTKTIGSNNPHNILRAVQDALLKTRSPRAVAEKRGMKVGEIISRRERGLKDSVRHELKDNKAATAA